MADPASILGIVNGAAGLALQCANIAQSLHDIADKYKHAELTILSMIQELDIVQLAWTEIERRFQALGGDEGGMTGENMQLLCRLHQSLRCGTLVMSAMEEELAPYRKDSGMMRVGQKMKVVWNEGAFRDHRDRIRGQVVAMNLLVSVLKLPTALQRSEVLCDKENLLRKCDESAYSIIPSKMSISIDDSERRRSIESTEMSYQQLSIDDDLFTAEVYKRNYRSTLIRQLLQEKRQVRAESPQSSYKISVANSDQSDYDLDSIHRRESSVYEECLENQKIARSEPQDNEPPSPTEIGSPSVPSKECQSLEPGLEKTMAEGQIYRHAHEKAKISWCDYQRSKSFESLAKSGETTQATFLLLSACYGEFDNISEVDLLLQKGANSNSRMSWGTGQTALHIAIRYQQPDVAEILIRYGADVNACDQVGSTPLHEAVRNKDPDMAFRLLQAGARVGCKNNSGQQAIHFAASSAYLVDLLLDNGASADCLDDNMYQPLHYLSHAMRGNCCEAALIKKGGNVESRSRWGYTPLQMACLFNRFTILRVLLSWGASLNVGDDFVATPLALATYNRNPSMVDFLLLSGVDANLSCDVTGRTVSHLIAQNNVGPNACDAAHGSTIIHLLARHGADFNVRDFQGNTVLHHMASRFSAASTTTEARRAIDAFIIHGADFNARNLKGQSPMFLAAKHLNVHLIRHFRRKGAASLTDDEFELLRRYWKEKSAFASQHMRERAEKLLVSFEDIENGYL